MNGVVISQYLLYEIEIDNDYLKNPNCRFKGATIIVINLGNYLVMAQHNFLESSFKQKNRV